jgi:hypothetical protein
VCGFGGVQRAGVGRVEGVVAETLVGFAVAALAAFEVDGNGDGDCESAC